ncbi:transglutaminase-like domain-containing protein [Sulfurimonas sp.]|uniref:transglutaminase-like domain-containing protein n=1 Tax=Sulfurimonas sp. TaxID=2022749 RepID=UPI00261E7A12|nr:transglutaminase-like domain-containing protein [Sulfurimonas sp.]
MKRRDFIKKSSITLGALATTPVVTFASKIENIKGVKSRKFIVNYNFEVEYNDKNFPAKLWNPLPFNASYQKVKLIHFDGNYDNYNINSKNDYDANTLFAEWKRSDKKKILNLQLEIETIYRTVPIYKIKRASKANLPLSKDVQQYLEPTAHIPIAGIIKQLADRITGDSTDSFEKIKKVYLWCASHTFRDKKVIGCGKGDVGKMITQTEVEDIYKNGYFGGKCTDLSSLFTAIARAAGIPTREVFGIRLGKSNFSKALGKSDAKGFATISTWQHCRAEYYIEGAGWIPTDPADITKLELVEGLKFNDSKVQKLLEKYMHSWEMNWVGFNHARDFKLFPQPKEYPLNMFGYPYAEVEDNVLNYYDPKTFEYKITSQEIL